MWWVCSCVMVCPDVVGLSCMQREFEERRNAEYVEVQRLEEEERRRTQAKVCARVYVCVATNTLNTLLCMACRHVSWHLPPHHALEQQHMDL